VNQILTYDDMVNIIQGAAFLGAGGGGSIVQGLAIINEIKDKGKSVKVVDPNSVDDEALVVVSAGMGSPAAAKYGWRNEHLPAFDLLEKYLGRKIDFIVPIEVGAGNFAVPMHTAAFRDRVLIDGDGAGRAIPELELTTFDIYGIPISPMAISDWQGNGAILFVKTAMDAERIARQITVAFQGNAGIALYPMKGKELKRVVIPGTISLAMKIGKILREVKERKLDVAQTLTKELEAFLLGIGEVEEKVIETKHGFDYGRVKLKVKEGDLIVYFKNENIVATLNEKVIAMAPDLICWVGLDGTPLTNADIEKGMKVAVIGLKAHERLRSEKALKAFSHLYKELGFDIKYKPIEELIK